MLSAIQYVLICNYNQKHFTKSATGQQHIHDFYDNLAKNIGNNNHNQLLLLYQNITQDLNGWIYLKWLQQYIALAIKQSDVYDPLKNIFSILTSPTTTYEQFRQHIYSFKHSQESDELYADEVISYINSKLRA